MYLFANKLALIELRISVRIKLLLYKVFKVYNIHVIYISVLLTTLVLINVFLHRKLDNEAEASKSFLLSIYAREIERVMLKDFKKFFQLSDKESYKEHDFDIIKNYFYQNHNSLADQEKTETEGSSIYLSNNILHIKNTNSSCVIDISNIKNLLDDIAKNLFNYKVSLNSTMMLTNVFKDLNDVKLFSIVITEDFKLNIHLEHNQNSSYISSSNNNLVNKKIAIAYTSLFIFFLGVFTIYYLLKQRYELLVEKIDKRNILSFIDKNKEYIIQCYEYSKKSQKLELIESNVEQKFDYLPLSIVKERITFNETEVILDKMVNKINNYFICYKSYNQVSNVNLDITYLKTNCIHIPFEYAEFYQILISIIYNLMNLNKKSSLQRLITIDFQKEQLLIFSNGLKLNKEYAIKASEMIFQDTANPYLMNFGQIFVLFNKYDIKFDVLHQDNGTQILICLPQNTRAKNNDLDKVINFKKYKNSIRK